MADQYIRCPYCTVEILIVQYSEYNKSHFVQCFDCGDIRSVVLEEHELLY